MDGQGDACPSWKRGVARSGDWATARSVDFKIRQSSVEALGVINLIITFHSGADSSLRAELIAPYEFIYFGVQLVWVSQCDSQTPSQKLGDVGARQKNVRNAPEEGPASCVCTAL